MPINLDKPQETDRAEAQEEADSLKGAAERNKLGQFSTLFPLASQMVKHVLSFLEPATPLRFLEPAVGTGVFFSALLRNTNAARVESAIGCEIDPSYGKIAQKIWQPRELNIITCDFIDFSLDFSRSCMPVAPMAAGSTRSNRRSCLRSRFPSFPFGLRMA